MPNIAVFGGNSYLASIIKNQSNLKVINIFFFQEKKVQKIIFITFCKKKIRKI